MVVAVDTRDPVVPVERSDVCVLLQQLLYTPLLSSSSRVISPYDLVPKRRSYMLMLRSRACFNLHAFLLAFARRHTHTQALYGLDPERLSRTAKVKKNVHAGLPDRGVPWASSTPGTS